MLSLAKYLRYILDSLENRRMHLWEDYGQSRNEWLSISKQKMTGEWIRFENEQVMAMIVKRQRAYAKAGLPEEGWEKKGVRDYHSQFKRRGEDNNVTGKKDASGSKDEPGHTEPGNTNGNTNNRRSNTNFQPADGTFMQNRRKAWQEKQEREYHNTRATRARAIRKQEENNHDNNHDNTHANDSMRASESTDKFGTSEAESVSGEDKQNFPYVVSSPFFDSGGDQQNIYDNWQMVKKVGQKVPLVAGAAGGEARSDAESDNKSKNSRKSRMSKRSKNSKKSRKSRSSQNSKNSRSSQPKKSKKLVGLTDKEWKKQYKKRQKGRTFGTKAMVHNAEVWTGICAFTFVQINNKLYVITTLK
jgi:hypothetical protein